MPFLLLLAYVALCVVAGYAGRHTRVGFWGVFFISILITPPVAVLLMILFHPRLRQ
jgi:hypothetical protein